MDLCGRPPQLHPIPALLQVGDELVDVGGGDGGLLGGAAQLDPRRRPALPAVGQLTGEEVTAAGEPVFYSGSKLAPDLLR